MAVSTLITTTTGGDNPITATTAAAGDGSIDCCYRQMGGTQLGCLDRAKIQVLPKRSKPREAAWRTNDCPCLVQMIIDPSNLFVAKSGWTQSMGSLW
jgi:hypothetical protein